MTTTDSVVTEVRGLTQRFGHRTVLDHIDFCVHRGEIFGLIGPNGAGKSTTIKILTTQLVPTGGDAKVAGFDVVTQAAEVRRHIGYVPQMLSADGALTARENLSLSAKLYGLPRADRLIRIKEALEFMALETFADKLVKTFSGGMIRRLELAQAMLHRPEVLILDEPTIGLDPVARRTVWDRLKELRQTYGIAVLLTTHDMDEADHLCDTLAILHAGKIAVIGKPAELKAGISPTATLNDVFAKFSGSTIQEGGNYHDARQARNTAIRLG